MIATTDSKLPPVLAGGKVILLCDDRDDRVASFLKDILPNEKPTRLVISDFAILHVDMYGIMRIIALFERKSLNDYADSIIDTRHNNRFNMMDLRKKYNCDVYYIVEGDLNKLEDRSHVMRGGADGKSSISMQTINTSIVNLNVRDNIYVAMTTCPEQTANKLREYVKSYSMWYSPPTDSVLTSLPIVGTGEIVNNTILATQQRQQECKLSDPQHQHLNIPWCTIGNLPQELVVKPVIPNEKIKEHILISIPYITAKNIHLYITRSIRTLFAANTAAPSGDHRPLPKATVNRLTKDPKLYLQHMLIQIPGISPKRAVKITEKYNLTQLATIEKIDVETIPAKTLAKIYTLFNI